MILRECGAGREFVAMIPPMRHPNRLAEAERQQLRAERTFQRMRSEDRRWASALASPMTLPAAVRKLAARCARVMYARLARIGGVR